MEKKPFPSFVVDAIAAVGGTAERDGVYDAVLVDGEKCGIVVCYWGPKETPVFCRIDGDPESYRLRYYNTDKLAKRIKKEIKKAKDERIRRESYWTAVKLRETLAAEGRKKLEAEIGGWADNLKSEDGGESWYTGHEGIGGVTIRATTPAKVIAIVKALLAAGIIEPRPEAKGEKEDD